VIKLVTSGKGKENSLSTHHAKQTTQNVSSAVATPNHKHYMFAHTTFANISIFSYVNLKVFWLRWILIKRFSMRYLCLCRNLMCLDMLID